MTAEDISMSAQKERLWTVSVAERGFDYWRSREYVDDKLRAQLQSADILIVPNEGFAEYKGPLFPVGTEGVYTYMKKNAPAGVNVDICVDDDKYKELALHFDWLIIPLFVVTALAAPTAVNLVSAYLKKRWGLGDGSAGEQSRGVKMHIVVEHKVGNDVKRGAISYEGSPEKLPESMKAAFDELRRNEIPVGELTPLGLPENTSATQTKPPAKDQRSADN
jgi:hypothetical protein